MKISVDVDCTPEEVRRLMGLPDLSSIHEVYLERMRKAVEENTGGEGMAALMQSWAPMGESGMAMWRQLLEGMGKAGTAK